MPNLLRTHNDIRRKCRVIRWKQYNEARRWSKKVSIKDFTEVCELRYERLPGYEDLTQAQYAALMRAKLRERTEMALEARKSSRPLGREALSRIKPGTRPHQTKTSTFFDHRPRILSQDPVRRHRGKAWYFDIYFDYQDCSRQYRKGKTDVVFPEGTYKPPLFTVGYRYDMLSDG